MSDITEQEIKKQASIGFATQMAVLGANKEAITKYHDKYLEQCKVRAAHYQSIKKAIAEQIEASK